jgi:hypothetical protein
MKTNIFAFEGDAPRPLIQIILILVVLIIGIVSTLMVCEWLFTWLITDKDLNALQQNYGSHSGLLKNLN